MPPRPKAISGPKSGSVVTPTMTSTPPETMGWTSTPSMASSWLVLGQALADVLERPADRGLILQV